MRPSNECASARIHEVLTDTTFWIDLLQERRRSQSGPASRFIASHRPATLEVSIITWGELAEGFPAVADLDRVLHRVRVLMLPRQVGWEASRIQRELSQAGARLGENDCWIAATARAWGLALVTADQAFACVSGLRTLGY